MMQNILDIIKIIKPMVMENLLQDKIFIKDNLKMMVLVDMEFLEMEMKLLMRDIGLMIHKRNME